VTVGVNRYKAIGQQKIPSRWGDGEEVRESGGWRWADPRDPTANGVRIVPAIPDLAAGCPGASDYVEVRHQGKVVGRGGQHVALEPIRPDRVIATDALDELVALVPEYPDMRIRLERAAWKLAEEAFEWPAQWDYLDAMEAVGDFVVALRAQKLIGTVLISAEEAHRYADLVEAIAALIDQAGCRAPFGGVARSEQWLAVRMTAQALFDSLTRDLRGSGT
jgi:hypothetical protein